MLTPSNSNKRASKVASAITNVTLYIFNESLECKLEHSSLILYQTSYDKPRVPSTYILALDIPEILPIILTRVNTSLSLQCHNVFDRCIYRPCKRRKNRTIKSRVSLLPCAPRYSTLFTNHDDEELHGSHDSALPRVSGRCKASGPPRFTPYSRIIGYARFGALSRIEDASPARRGV